MRITVFTPTYNRGYIIKTLYESLKRQTFKDFEWVVINDGSTDDTDNLFYNEILPDEHFFDITYKTTQNGGKHRAINNGLDLAKGELFFIVDSDDYLTDTSLELINSVENTVSSDEKKYFAGVCGAKGYAPSIMVGKTYEGNKFLDITMLERSKHNIYGDKSEVFYTDILRKYKFPEFESEKFLTECVVWDKIAFDGYKLRFFNDIVYICDYLDDGLSKNLARHEKSSPKGKALYLYQTYKFGKTSKYDAWNYDFLNYYYSLKKTYSIFTVGKFLHQNPLAFAIKITYIRIRNKIKHILKIN